MFKHLFRFLGDDFRQMRAGCHIATLEMTSTSGKRYAYTWAFEGSETAP
jgi:hypothetical protein